MKASVLTLSTVCQLLCLRPNSGNFCRLMQIYLIFNTFTLRFHKASINATNSGRSGIPDHITMPRERCGNCCKRIHRRVDDSVVYSKLNRVNEPLLGAMKNCIISQKQLLQRSILFRKLQKDVTIGAILAASGCPSRQLLSALMKKPTPETHNVLAYQMLAKSDNPRLSYRNSTAFNTSTVRYLSVCEKHRAVSLQML